MKYKINIADLERDQDSILALWLRNFSTIDKIRYQWLYLRNQAGQPVCFLLKSPEQEVIGLNGLIHRKIKIQNNKSVAGHAIDLLVDKKYRTVGPALQLQRSLIQQIRKQNIPLIFGFPLPAAQLILRRVGYQDLGIRERWVKPLYSYHILKKEIFSQYLTKIITNMIDVGIRIKSKEIFYRRPKGIQINENLVFDKRFDILWNEASNQFNVIGERTSEYLQWRFKQAPNKYKLFSLENKNCKLIAYIIYRKNGRLVSIEDMFFLNIKSLKMLLIEFTRAMRSAGIYSLTFFYLGSQKISKTLNALGFFKRPEESKVLIYINDGVISGKEGVEDYKQWFITNADKDG